MQTYQKSRVYLRGVNLSLLAEKYIAGEFFTLLPNMPTNIAVTTGQSNILITNSEENINKSYECDLGSDRTFAKLDCKIYHQPKGYNCMYCLRKIIDHQPIGIPIKRQEKQGLIYYHMVDVFCSFSCTSSETRKKENYLIF